MIGSSNEMQADRGHGAVRLEMKNCVQAPASDRLDGAGRAGYDSIMTFKVELEREEDGRWIGEISDLPGVLAYGSTAEEARAKAQALALRVLADRIEHGEAESLSTISFAAA